IGISRSRSARAVTETARSRLDSSASGPCQRTNGDDQAPPSGMHALPNLIVLAPRHASLKRTYSKSRRCELMPRAGGAIQFANWPGALTAFVIRLRTYA